MRGSLALAIAAAVVLAGEAYAGRPGQVPDSAWMHAARSRLATHASMRRDLSNQGKTCTPATPLVQAPKDNLWLGLTDDEAVAVTEWLFLQEDLNLTTSFEAGEWDNTISLVELMPPRYKTEVLEYLDGEGGKPARYAKVVLSMRASTDPTWTDLLVGPLPVDNSTTKWEYLEYPYTRKTSGSIRNLAADMTTLYAGWLNVIGSNISDITTGLWNGTATGGENDTMDIWGIEPLLQDDGRIVRWDTFWNRPSGEFDTATLLPLGLFIKSDVTGRDPTQWKLEGFLYNDVFYETEAQLREAFNSDDFVRLLVNVDDERMSTDQAGEVPAGGTELPPLAVSPSGARHAVDHAAKYVEWMDWSFYIGVSRDTGIHLHDIRFKGQRIIYELALQEALAHYSGNDPVQGNTAYLDSFYGFSPFIFELIPGYDCPSYATFMNVTSYVDEGTLNHINSLCLFEFDADYPMARHSSFAYTAATKNVYFVLRWVTTLGNYDYMFSYEFYLDGSMKVKVQASGYIQTAYFANNEEYGYQIGDALSGSVHDHVMNFKVDFDVLGTQNSLELTTFTPEEKNFAWSNTPRRTFKLERAMVENEDDGRMNWSPNGVTQYRVVNDAEEGRNKYGELRGYRIFPSDTTAHLTMSESSVLRKAVHPFTFDLAVTRQKDTELRSAHSYNNQDVNNPMVDFDEFFDGESLRQEDITLWFTLGMHHLPHTGDLPNTVLTTAHSAVTFAPVNYFDMDPSVSSANRVKLTYFNGTVLERNTFGQNETVCRADVQHQDPGLDAYQGSYIVRKFPYDPQNPLYLNALLAEAEGAGATMEEGIEES